MKKVKEIATQIWKDESGQGATEYILLLVIVVGLAMMFKDQIRTIISEKMADLSSRISGFAPN